MKKSLPIFVVLMMAVTANAAITGYFDGGTALNLPTAGTPVVVNLMLVDTDTDWTNAYLNITLSAGSFYEELVFGNDNEPNPALLGIVPDLAFDSYLDTPGPYSTADTASFAPGKTITPTVYDVSWFDDPNFPDGPGVGQQIAQLTLSPDAQGTVYGVVFDIDTAGVGVEVLGYSVVDGHIVPEPVTLALLASGGICVLLRKKR